MREEYLRKLEMALSEYGKELREDILTEFEAHFNEAKLGGLSDEDIITELGPVEDVAESIKSMYDKAPAVETKHESRDVGSATNGAYGAAFGADYKAEPQGEPKPEGEPREEKERKSQESFQKRSDRFKGQLKAQIRDLAEGKADKETFANQLKDLIGDFMGELSEIDVFKSQEKPYVEPIEIHIDEYDDGRRSKEEPERAERVKAEREREEKGNRVEQDNKTSSSTELGFLIDEVDTIVVDGNVDLFLAPGNNGGRWEFRPSKSFEIGISIFNSFKNFSFGDSEAGNLEVATVGNTARFTLPKGSGTLRIEVLPSVRFVYVNGKSGDLDMAGVNLIELNAKNISGDYSIRDSRVDRAILSTTSGDINFNNLWGAIDLSTVSGDVYIRGHQGPEVKARSVSGDLDINSTSPFARIESTSGDLDIDMNGAIEFIQLNSMSGDIDLRTASKDYTASTATVSGEVDNHTGLPEQRMGWGKKTIGMGQAQVLINTVSGDIYLG